MGFIGNQVEICVDIFFYMRDFIFEVWMGWIVDWFFLVDIFIIEFRLKSENPVNFSFPGV